MDIEAYSHQLIVFGATEGMQDLYVQPVGDGWQLYFRRGNDFFGREELLADQAQQLIGRFKYLGEMDVSEKRKVQLGAITYAVDGLIQRLRLSTVGNYRLQESLVVRFLHGVKDNFRYFLPEQFVLLAEQTRPIGLYLFSGPTGSGKTTLMYHLARQEKGQVITIEDPVEIEEAAFLQLQTNRKIGLDYEELIQLSLRHRPDVLIVGEIRDPVTAQAAIRAALTGHKVFATIHSRGVTASLDRMFDFVGNNQELANCLAGIIYQRLLPDLQGELAALAAYHFYGEPEITQSWSASLTKSYQRGLIDEACYQKEH